MNVKLYKNCTKKGAARAARLFLSFNQSCFWSVTSLPLPSSSLKLSIIHSDNDGIENKFDNCMSHPNPDQLDTDEDGRGIEFFSL